MSCICWTQSYWRGLLRSQELGGIRNVLLELGLAILWENFTETERYSECCYLYCAIVDSFSLPSWMQLHWRTTYILCSCVCVTVSFPLLFVVDRHSLFPHNKDSKGTKEKYVIKQYMNTMLTNQLHVHIWMHHVFILGKEKSIITSRSLKVENWLTHNV